MKKRALVLSGGGAKGAFQLGALQYLRENGYAQWNIIAGVSVGALNGTIMALDKLSDLEKIWGEISNGTDVLQQARFILDSSLQATPA